MNERLVKKYSEIRKNRDLLRGANKQQKEGENKNQFKIRNNDTDSSQKFGKFRTIISSYSEVQTSNKKKVK